MKRLLLFGLSIASLLVLTYAGVLLAFSVEVTDEMAAANPDMRRGSRAVVVPLSAPSRVATLVDGTQADLLVRGDTGAGFPTGATDVRVGRALTYVPAGSNGTIEVPNANATLDVGALSGGAEGWILRGDGEADPWFAPAAGTIGRVDRYATSGTIGALFALGSLGFVAPLVAVVLTHKGARARGPPGAPAAVATPTFCRECRASMAPDAKFCMRCGAWIQGEGPAHA